MESRNTFRPKLAEIASKLDGERFERLKFLCKDLIPDGNREKIGTPELLFLELEQRKEITPNCLQFLITCLENVGRKDLADDLRNYERGGTEEEEIKNSNRRGDKDSVEKAESHNNRGRVEFQDGRYENACQHYTAALECIPKDKEKDRRVKYLCNRAACYLKLRKFKEAYKDCDLALLLNPRNVKARYRLVQSLQGEGKIAEAFTEVTSLQQKNPEDAKEKAMKKRRQGNLCFQKSKYDEAMKHFCEAILLLPQLDIYATERKQCYWQRAECYLRKNNLEAALRDCDEADRLVPEDVLVLYTKMQVLDMMNRYRECYTVCNRLVEKNVKVAEAEETINRLLPKIVREDEESKMQEAAELSQNSGVTPVKKSKKKPKRGNKRKKGLEKDEGTSEETEPLPTAAGRLNAVYSNTTQSLSGEGDLETEEEAARKILSEAEMIQDSLSNSDTTENRDHGMDTRKEDLELLINDTFVESGEKEPQTTEAVYFLPKAEIVREDEESKTQEAAELSQNSGVTPVKKSKKKPMKGSEKNKGLEKDEGTSEETEPLPSAAGRLNAVYSNTTQSLTGEGDLETEEEAARKILSEVEVIQDSLINGGTTENMDHGMDTRKEDLELLINDTFVESSEKEPQTTEAVYFLPKAEVKVGLDKAETSVPTDLNNISAESSTGEAYPRRILFICDRWSCWHRTVCTVNRQLCRSFAKVEDIHVACLVLNATDQETIGATREGVNLIQATPQPGIPQGDEQLLHLHTDFPFKVDLVVGHGMVSGPAAAIQANRLNCKRLHIFHNLPGEGDDCHMGSLSVDREETERDLGLSADFVAGIGPLVVEHWKGILNEEVFTIIPGLSDVAPRNQIMTPQCRCLILGNMNNPAISGLELVTAALGYCRQREHCIHLTVMGTERENVQDLKQKIETDLGYSRVRVAVKPFDVSQEAVGVEVRGVSLVLIPSPSDGFGMVALEAIAAKVPILVTSSSGIAVLIQREFGGQFLKLLCSTKDDTDCADAWTSSIDEVLSDREEAFNMAASLWDKWNSKFTWGSATDKLLKQLGSSGFFSVVSPSSAKQITLPSQCSGTALRFMEEEVDLLNRRRKHVLFLSPENAKESPFIHYFAQVPWAAVLDFDVNSVKTGFLSSCESFCENMGMKICRILPPSPDEERKKCSFVLLTGVPWVLLEGMPESKRSIRGNLEWIREFFLALGRAHQMPITFLVLWKSLEETETLCKNLSKILTVVQGSPLFSQVKLVIASTGDIVPSPLSDIADDWSIKVRKISLEDICNALCQCVSSSPFIQENQDFSLPVADPDDPQKVVFKILPPSSRWINAEMEVLFQSVGSTPQFETDDACHFYRGGLISWYALQMGYAVERGNWNALKLRVDELLARAGTVTLRMPHQRGAGGSTSARKILFDYHEKYPCVFLKSVGHAEVAQGIKVLAEFCRLPVIILVDCKQAQSDEFDVDTLFNILSNDRIPCVILEVIHQTQKKAKNSSQSTEKSERAPPVRLADALDFNEAREFVEIYSAQRKDKLSKLRSLLHHGPKQLQIPFFYALTTFEDRFTRLEPFVKDCLQELGLREQKVLLFLAMAYHYGHNSLSANEFAGLLQAPRREVISLESVLPEVSRDLLLEEDDKWRPRHDLIAVEMLRQLLTMSGPKGSPPRHPDNWKNQLAEKALDFFAHMSENVVSDVLLSRVPDDTSHQYISFSQVISDIPFEEDAIKLFEKAISLFPDNPFFKVHLGRFYSIQKKSAGFSMAIKYTDEGICCSQSYSRLARGQFAQMKGVVYSREVNYLIEQNAGIQRIIQMAEEGVTNFRRAVSIAPDFVNGYIPEVRMMCKVFEYIDNKTGNVFEYVKSANAHPFIIDAISDTSNTLECVPDSDEYPHWRMRLACLGRRHFSPLQVKETLELLYYLRNSGRASRGSINRQIVIMTMDMCTKNGESLSVIAAEMIELLNEALKHDTNIEQTMRLWVRLAPFIPVSLSEAESKVFHWCTKEKSVRSYLYKFIIACLHLLEGGSSTYREIMKNAYDDLNSEIKAINRPDVGRCRHPDRPVVWLAQKGKGMGHLVCHDDKISQLQDVRLKRFIDSKYTKQLRPLTGLIVKTGPKVGTIRINGQLDVTFRADLCEIPLVSSAFTNRKVQFFLAFTFFGTDAYNVRLVAE